MFLNEFRLTVDFMPILFAFQIFGRKKEGKFSRNLDFARSISKLWVLFGLLRGLKKLSNESGN